MQYNCNNMNLSVCVYVCGSVYRVAYSTPMYVASLLWWKNMIGYCNCAHEKVIELHKVIIVLDVRARVFSQQSAGSENDRNQWRRGAEGKGLLLFGKNTWRKFLYHFIIKPSSPPPHNIGIQLLVLVWLYCEDVRSNDDTNWVGGKQKVCVCACW